MKRSITAVVCIVFPALACAAETTVTLNLADAKGVGAAVGTVRILETPYGLAFYPNLKALAPGLHGFHVHQNPSCAPAEKDGASVAALAAGGHLDPQGTKRHGEPWGDGHLGDLPALYVAADGSATSPVLAPRLKLSDVANRSLMVHAGGDNHSDHPAALGGGGARVACGVIGG
ncbi:MAG TPA: superoxide dismutase [Cu-Zn] SodC [Accumulibacter sp.]|uniref:superoxide dismutase [Cu-Zn] SodC n=1 Tax=Accumulibacter sp. TaxID=2053492 RepID=UPI000EBC114A|nr:superoxide dismutase [Cu-Zn] SodC [Accumulibacter sp.]HCZ14921.1 superoxide dismutase [Cu-Zn] SodC2 [Accumulibacter sp.]HRF71919.1 superoxide dismutase [Cu-Zn] SodC [Accumulibacter sp.]